MNDTNKMVSTVVNALFEKKAQNIKALDISALSNIGDAFVIASATNSSQVSALIDEVQKQMHEQGYPTRQIEGTQHSGWVLMDFYDVIVHVFTLEDRVVYNIEKVWAEAKEINIDSMIKEV